ncbi:MAG: CPBP family intramembrane glutamic endopeptidase [Saprospiraceae bacterium]
MELKTFLQTKNGAAVELSIFYIVAVSISSMFACGFILYPLALTSLGVRKIEWRDIGFGFKDFTIFKILLGVAVAVAYYFIDQNIVNPIASRFAAPGLPEIFNIQGDVSKYIIGLTLSWTTAAFLEEIVFRGYLINRFIDLMWETLITKILIILMTGIGFGFVHSYQGMNGAISAGFIGVFQAMVYFMNGKKLAIPIIAHGVYDTIGFTLLFLG